VTVAGALLSLLPLRPTSGGITTCGSSAPQCNGSCPDSLNCVPVNATACICAVTGCCRLNEDVCEDGVTNSSCRGRAGIQFVENGSCDVECAPPTATPTDTPTATPSATPTATATATKVPNGGACMDPSDCVSGNCVDDICAAVPAPAPAVSGSGLVAGLLILTVVAALAFWRRARG